MTKYQAKNGNDCPLNGSCHKSKGEGSTRSITGPSYHKISWNSTPKINCTKTAHLFWRRLLPLFAWFPSYILLTFFGFGTSIDVPNPKKTRRKPEEGKHRFKIRESNVVKPGVPTTAKQLNRINPGWKQGLINGIYKVSEAPWPDGQGNKAGGNSSYRPGMLLKVMVYAYIDNTSAAAKWKKPPGSTFIHVAGRHEHNTSRCLPT